MLRTLATTLLLSLLASCPAQPPADRTRLSEDFDRSPPFHYRMPDRITATDTCPAWHTGGQRILLTGKVYARDGQTPAPGVLLYYYHTGPDGTYATDPAQPRNVPRNRPGQTHGYRRGWVRTDQRGRYAIYTTRPGAYPGRDDPAHVHLYVADPLLPEPTYLDDFVFDDDPLLTSARRQRLSNRGGSGVVRLARWGDLLIGERNLILGLNVPGYPTHAPAGPRSGAAIGEDIHSFTPFHAWGPDRGTRTCPVCKYGWYHGVLYFVGNRPDWAEIRRWLLILETESERRADYLKVYFVYGNAINYDEKDRRTELAALGRELGLERIALTFVPSFSDRASEIHRIAVDPEVGNTLLLFRRRNVIANYVDLAPTPENVDRLRRRLDETANEYFALPRIPGE